ncbi:hypothetical protein [Mesorhizobium sp. YM1C-6-2]|uniref:hypothetical protein n=1 Tax=Mesorhizobium sp. YM1C-6-2 TaxID=1827501 RepID=UPI000EF17E10|nr:hypothetical protein [Mesorhizobium sp. YM1C-6-2]RLP26333.1 hypothetical protein D8676_11725 [Mesorhizobium sp. YM1C-6-2]
MYSNVIPIQKNLLRRAVDDYCSTCGIVDSNERMYVAGLVGAFFSTGLISMKDLHRGLSDAMGPWETALIVLQRLQ